MISKSESTLGERIKIARVKAGFLTQQSLARAIGKITRSAVSQWEADDSQPSTEHLLRIATLCGVSQDWLSTGRDAGLQPILDKVFAKVIGSIDAAVWREGESVLQVLENPQQADPQPIVPAVPKDWLQGLQQFAFSVRDQSMNLTAHFDEYAICVRYREIRPGGAQDGDLVVVEYRRPGEHKTMLRRLRFHAGQWSLHCESTDPKWANAAPIMLAPDLTKDASGTALEIIALAFSFYRDNTGPIIGNKAINRLGNLAGAILATSTAIHSIIGGFILASIGTMSAAFATFLMAPLDVTAQAVFIGMVPVVLAALMFGPTGVGCATVTHAAGSLYFVCEPTGSFAAYNFDDLVSVCASVACGLLLAFMSADWRKSESQPPDIRLIRG